MFMFINKLSKIFYIETDPYMYIFVLCIQFFQDSFMESVILTENFHGIRLKPAQIGCIFTLKLSYEPENVLMNVSNYYMQSNFCSGDD